MSALINSYGLIKSLGTGVEHNPTTTAVKITGFDSGVSSTGVIADYLNSKIVFKDNGSFKLDISVLANANDLESYTFQLRINDVIYGDLDIELERKENSLEFHSTGYLPEIVLDDEVELFVLSGNAAGASFIPTHLLIDAFKVGT